MICFVDFISMLNKKKVIINTVWAAQLQSFHNQKYTVISQVGLNPAQVPATDPSSFSLPHHAKIMYPVAKLHYIALM